MKILRLAQYSMVLNCLIFSHASLAQSDTYITLPSVHNVMTGNAAGGANQLWFRVSGQPAGVPSQCVWNGYSLFYISPDGSIDPQKAMALLLTAQMGNVPVQIEFNVVATQNNFWGWGFSNCEVHRMLLGS